MYKRTLICTLRLMSKHNRLSGVNFLRALCQQWRMVLKTLPKATFLSLVLILTPNYHLGQSVSNSQSFRGLSPTPWRTKRFTAHFCESLPSLTSSLPIFPRRQIPFDSTPMELPGSISLDMEFTAASTLIEVTNNLTTN